MDWIKKNYDQFTLAVMAVAVLGTGFLLYRNASTFSDRFAEALATPSKNNQIPKVNTAKLDEARQEFEKPTVWSPRKQGEDLLHSGLLFTSELYYVNKAGQLEKPGVGALYNDSLTGKPIENRWFITNGLPLLDSNVCFHDPDGDGFLNEDEWRGKTDPNNKAAHPPLFTKLFFKAQHTEPFRFKYQADDGDPKTPEAMTFQINPLDAGGRTKFVKLGEPIEGTRFKLVKWEFKDVLNPRIQEKEDVSELTLENTETGEPVVLVKGRVVDSPNRFADFEYRWNKQPAEPGQVFRVPKTKEFVLQPTIDQKYKLLDVNDSGAVIQRPDGEKYQVPMLPKK
jgi:hypothetical protein